MHKFTKMSNITGGKLAALLAAVAASATLTVHAATATRNWIHGEEGVANTPESPYTIQNLANWDGSGAIGDGHDNDLHLSVTERTYIKSTQGESSAERLGNGLFLDSGEFVFTGPLWNYAFRPGAADSTVVISKNGDWTFKSQFDTRIGVGVNSTVVFTNESGNVNVTASANSWHKIGTGVSSYAKVVNLSGNWTFANNLLLADSAGSTGIVENVSGDWSVGGDLRVANRDYGEFTKYGGSLTVGGDMYIHYESTGYGVLTIKGGTVTVSSAKSVQLKNGTGTINLDGGTLVTPQVSRSNGTLTLNFNGGTLKANASANLLATDHDNMVVHVNAGGGVIDCGGNAVTLKPKIGRSGDTGSLTFTGGNIITIDNDIYYGGVTYIASNTTVKATNARISALLSHGVALVEVTETGTYTVLTSDDDLSSLSTLTNNVTCPAASSFDVNFADEGKSITVTVTALKPNYWTGVAGDNNLSTAGNWSDNNVPTGNAVIFSVGSVMLTKGASFAPASITFDAGSAPVTIAGDDFTGIAAITNLSAVSHTVNAKVYFTGGINVKQNAAGYGTIGQSHVTFAGGAYAASGKTIDSGYSVAMFGKYYFANTSESPWTATTSDLATREAIAENSSLYIPYAGNLEVLHVGAGAKVDVGNLAMSAGGRPSWRNCGEVIVTNVVMTGSDDRFCTYAQSDSSTSSTFKFNCVTNSMSGNWFYFVDQDKASTTYVYIGAGGLNFTGNKAVYAFAGKENSAFSGNKVVVRPWYSDFTIAEGGNSDGAVQFRQNVEFCTDDESGAGRTITINAKTRGRKDASNNVPVITVSGRGKLQVNGVPNNEKHPVVTVTDTATLAFGANGNFGAGTITLDDGTTLEYTNVGNTLALPCSTLVLPSTGTATLRINGGRLKGGDHILVAGVFADAASHLNVELANSVKDGRRYDVAVKDGNLVLSINQGMMLIIR